MLNKRQSSNLGRFTAQFSLSTPILLKNYWTDFHYLFKQFGGISVAINVHICKAMVHSISECESK